VKKPCVKTNGLNGGTFNKANNYYKDLFIYFS
jgi:hypothetical protein